MARFQVQTPDGKTIEIDAETPEAATNALRGLTAGGEKTQHAMPDAPRSSVAGDVAKSFGTGLAKGVIGLATMPGNIQSMMQAGLDYVAPETGKRLRAQQDAVDASMSPTMRALASPKNITAPEMQRKIESVTGEFHKPETTAGEYAGTIGEFAPNVAFPGSASQRVLQWLVPAVTSETAGQMTKGTKAEPWARAGGAIVGSVIPAVAGRAITPLPAPAERTRQVAVLDREGVTTTAGQATGSRPLQWLEATASETPLSAGAARRITDTQGEQFTAAALRRVGENATRAEPEVLDRAFRRIGAEFDRLASNNNITFNATRHAQTVRNDLNSALLRVENDYAATVPASIRSPVVENLIQDVYREALRGQITGGAYQAWRSRLSRLSNDARNDPQLSRALGGIRDALDDAMGAMVSPADRAAWNTARAQWRNLMTVERAATAGGENAAMGIISPAQLRIAATAQNRRGYARGQGDLDELARAGVAAMTPLPNSGTPGRMAAQASLGALGASGGALVAGAPGAAAGAVGGLALPGIAGRALMSRPVQGYLRNQTLARPLNAIDAGQMMRAQSASAPEQFAEEGGPKEVRSMQDALRLPKNTPFVDPEGVVRISGPAKSGGKNWWEQFRRAE